MFFKRALPYPQVHKFPSYVYYYRCKVAPKAFTRERGSHLKQWVLARLSLPPYQV